MPANKAPAIVRRMADTLCIWITYPHQQHRDGKGQTRRRSARP